MLFGLLLALVALKNGSVRHHAMLAIALILQSTA